MHGMSRKQSSTRMSYRFRDHSKSDTSRDADDGKSMGNNSNDSKGPPDRMFGAMDNDKSSRDDTDDRFSKYGKSTDSNRSRRPALYGRGRRPSPTRDKGYGDRGRDYPYSRDDVASRDRSPMRGSFDDRFADRYKKDEGLYPRRDELGRKDLQRTPVFDDLLREKYSGLETRSRYDIQGNFNSRYEAPDDPYKLRQLNYPSVYKDYYKNEGMPKPNECEIIVVNKMQRPYAETVEQRMKNLGIQVDILFLKDEGLLIQTIDDIARRGSLYAVVISPQNEVHGSVTLNILYGTPQEHRNMPLDDALKLVARNYHEHIRTQREGTDRERVERGPYVGALPADREIQFLLRVLADGRTISLDEIETVIRYLQERRDKLKSTQGDRTPVASIPPDLNVVPPAKIKEEPPVLSQKQQDLQHRIMNLITHGGQGSGAGSPAGAGNSGGMSVSQSVSGSMVPGSGLGQNPSGAGRSQPPLGPNPTNMGSHQSGIGHNDPNISTKLPEMGLKQHGIGQNQSVISGLGSNHSVPGSNQSSIVTNQPGMGLNTQPTSSPSTYINFDNPSVQKALDNLMQSGGPNLLKNISLTGSGTCGSQGISGNSQMKQPPPSNVGSSINPQSGPGPMGDHSGSMGPGIVHQQVGNMGHQPGSSMSRQSGSSMSHQPGSNMGHQQGSNMGHQQGSNMGHQTGSNMGHQTGSNIGHQPGSNMVHQPGSNMGHQPGSNMGHQPGSNMGHQPGSNMSHQQGSNMSHQPSSNMNHQQSGSNMSHQQSNSMSHQQGGTINQQQQQGGNNMGPPQGPGMGLHQGPNIGPGPMSGMGTGHGPFPGPGMYGIGPNMMGHLPPRYPMMGGPTGNHSSMMGGMGGGPHRY